MSMASKRISDWSLYAFSAAGPLAAPEVQLTHELAGEPERHLAGDWLVEEGDAILPASLIVSGWAAQARVLSDGRRQIGRILLPGDVSGLGGPVQIAVVALTDLVTVDVTRVRKLVEQGASEPLCRVWKAMQLTEHASALAHIMRLGRFTAYERTGHLLLELYERLAAVDLAEGATMPMPLTQEVLADCLGLSIVHLNRMIQQLRRNRLIGAESRRVSFPDLERLAQDSHYPLRAEGAQSVPRLRSI